MNFEGSHTELGRHRQNSEYSYNLSKFTETPRGAINVYRLFAILSVQELIKICLRLTRVTEIL